jgi:aminoglycoside phosphotransferase (APT) family kinase protein
MVDDPTELLLSEVLLFLPDCCRILKEPPQKSATFGINSNNFRFQSGGKAYLLKRWSQKANIHDVQSILNIMCWLGSEQLPVPVPLQFRQGEVLLKINSGLWSLFPFVEGNYFSGVDNELEVVAKMTARITKTLQRLPREINLGSGPQYFSNRENLVFCKTEDEFDNWESLFGLENSELLHEWWPRIRAEWDSLKKSPPASGVMQAAHYDMHPHNILIEKNQISAILDFESCKQMDPGYALGFAALKQCRQAVAHSLKPLDAEIFGEKYISVLQDHSSFCKAFASNLGDFAVSEALRRICLILELNLSQRCTTWNHVLSIQIKHIGEARALFGN